ncbi:DUF45 domain-containing protein [candidate division KSB1 bacterium]|nr:DUF45 domain-containing protein [candidate division KSB1 bacterium]
MIIKKRPWKMIQVDELGTVRFRRNKRAKRLIIRVRPFQPVQVTVPSALSYKEAEGFVRSKIPWIQKHLKEMQNLAPPPDSPLNEREAKRKIINRTEELAARYKLSPSGITLRRQKTRWGSCSAKDRLSLNIKIALLPPELMDYIILHELVHIRIKNHSTAFWKELDKLVGNAKSVDRRLKKYHPLMYHG